jgi:hypothetical protein
MSFADFIKNDNKSIIWGLLQEGGIFNDIPNNMFDTVKRLFESSILSMKPEFDIFFDKNDEGDEDYDKKASEMIINSNKTVIKKMIHEISKFKKPQQQIQVPRVMNPITLQQQQQQQQQHQNSSNFLPIPPRFDTSSSRDMNKAVGKKPKIEEIYRADDLQKNRMSELESRMKEKQQEMDSMLHNKKPENIDFSDNKLNDNKLASDEMEKLLAEALSSRNQELKMLALNNDEIVSKTAEEWITGSSDPVTKAVNTSIAVKRANEVKRPLQTNTNALPSTQKKNVSFNEQQNEKILYEKEEKSNEYTESLDGNSYTNMNDSKIESKMENSELSFLSKLKVKNNTSDPLLVSNSKKSNTFIPLDDYNTDLNHDDDDADTDNNAIASDNHKPGMYIYVNEKTRGTTDAGDYHKFENSIEKLKNDVETIKNNQEKILELLMRITTMTTNTTLDN